MFIVKKENNVFVNKTKIDNKYCLKVFNDANKKCIKFLNCIENNGFYKCPYGFSIKKCDEFILCSLVVNGFSDLKSLRFKVKNNQLDFVPQINKCDEINFDDFYVLEREYSLKSNCFHDINNGNTNILDIISSIKNAGSCSNVANSLIILFDDLFAACRACKEESQKLVQGEGFLDKYNFYINKINLYDSCFKVINETIAKIKTNYSQYYETNSLCNKNEKSLYDMFCILEYRIVYMNAILYENYNVSKVKLNIHSMILKLANVFKQSAKNRNLIFKINNLSENENLFFYSTNDIFLALFILFENAVKYSIPESAISIELKKKADLIAVRIVNKSNFISENSITHIKERGFSGENRLNGNGFGLYIVDSICERTNTKFNVEYLYKEKIFIAELLISTK